MIKAHIRSLLRSDTQFKKRLIYTHFYENEPILEKHILYEVFHGRLMSCNPYAIFKEVLRDERFRDYTHIWVLSSADFIPKELKSLKNLILVRKESHLYLRYLASAKYLINNTTFPYYFIRRKDQLYLNTWHGTALKCLGKYIQTKFMEHDNTQRNFLQVSHFANPSLFMQDVLLRDYDVAELFSGKALISGYARIDLTLKVARENELIVKGGLNFGENLGENLSENVQDLQGGVDFVDSSLRATHFAQNDKIGENSQGADRDSSFASQTQNDKVGVNSTENSQSALNVRDSSLRATHFAQNDKVGDNLNENSSENSTNLQNSVNFVYSSFASQTQNDKDGVNLNVNSSKNSTSSQALQNSNAHSQNYDTQNTAQRLRERFGIRPTEKVLLYAPTYRGYFGDANFEYEKISSLLKTLSLTSFKVLFKGHYETLKYIEIEKDRVCDANDRDIDTNELLGIVDLLITDYSSIAFDYMVLDKPIIYYCYDYEEYKKERGIYFDLEDLGLSYVKTVDEILGLLNDEKFLNAKNRYSHLKQGFLPLEDGFATKRVIEFFFFDSCDKAYLYDASLNQSYAEKRRDLKARFGVEVQRKALDKALNLRDSSLRATHFAQNDKVGENAQGLQTQNLAQNGESENEALNSQGALNLRDSSLRATHFAQKDKSGENSQGADRDSSFASQTQGGKVEENSQTIARDSSLSAKARNDKNGVNLNENSQDLNSQNSVTQQSRNESDILNSQNTVNLNANSSENSQSALNLRDSSLSEKAQNDKTDENSQGLQAQNSATSKDETSPKHSQKILFFAGSFLANGITSAFKNLLAISGLKPYLAIEKGGIEADEAHMNLFKEASKNVIVLPKVGTVNLSLEEANYFLDQGFLYERSEDIDAIFARIWQREYRRLYGDTKFDLVVNYDGYNRYFTYLFAYAPIKKFIYAHNDMLGEFYKKFPYLRGNFYLYKKYDKILSVSAATSDENKANLALKYHINEDKFTPLPNFINPKEVLVKSKIPLSSKEKGYFKGVEVFINLARLSIEKDQESLIKAFVKFHAKHKNTRLLILGEGSSREHLEHLIKSLKAKSFVHLLGFIPNPYKFLKHSQFFVLSSKHEGQALVLAEAMILEKPIICTNFTCAKDFLGDDEYGLVVEKGEEGILNGLFALYENKPGFKKFDVALYNEKIKKEFERIYFDKP
ncbi:hypothetical protein DMC01_01895 [Campylobacter troglodytis]|nr:hypothetical protein DMC01_01895 [Campylobacter troglodytis]